MKMNKWNRLLDSLDVMFGFTNKKESTFRKIGQTFDERTGEHVFQIEYRVRRGGDAVSNRKTNNLFNTIMKARINDITKPSVKKKSIG